MPRMRSENCWKRKLEVSDEARGKRVAKTDAQRKVVNLLTSPTLLGRPIAVGPRVPSARVAMLRAAFQKMTADPAFLKGAGKLHIEVDPVKGEALQKVVQEVLDTPKDVIAQAKKINE